MSPLDVMIDFETMGTGIPPAVVSLGAVAFDPRGEGSHSDEFYVNIDLQSCISYGFRVDGSTVMWWLGQSASARRSLFDPKPVAFDVALERFTTWFKKHTAKGSCIWSHGAGFDITILEQYYKALSRAAPWFFSNARDTRTLFDLAGYKLPKADLREDGHNSLADSRVQAFGVQEAIRRLTGNTSPDPDTLASVEL